MTKQAKVAPKQSGEKAKTKRGRPPIGRDADGAARTGRGRPADAVGREAILKAAERVLRRIPPPSITRLAIAEEAGVDPNLVRYYFGTVPELMSEVVLSTHKTIFNALDEAPPDDAIDWLRLRIQKWLAMFIENPFHHQLLLQVMYADLESEEHTAWVKSLSRSIGYTEHGLKVGSENGQLRTVDPRFLQLALLGMTEFFANNGDIIADLFGKDATPENLQQDYLEFVTDLVLNGLRLPG